MENWKVRKLKAPSSQAAHIANGEKEKLCEDAISHVLTTVFNYYKSIC